MPLHRQPAVTFSFSFRALVMLAEYKQPSTANNVLEWT
jgi:hypothetical protein